MKQNILKESIEVFKKQLDILLKNEIILKKRYNDAIDNTEEYCYRCYNQEYGNYVEQYTSHGIEHTARVFSFALCLSKNYNLNATELLILGIAAILHDIEMTASLSDSIITKDANKEERWDEKRKMHGNAIAKILKEKTHLILSTIVEDEDFYLNDFLSLVCSSHYTSKFAINIFNIRNLMQDKKTKERFDLIAGILLLSEELDLSYKRVLMDKGIYNELKSNVSRSHWWKKLLISKVTIEGKNINISYIGNRTIENSNEFIKWTIAELEIKLQLLKSNFEDVNLWDYIITKDEVLTAPWLNDFKYIPDEVRVDTIKTRMKINGQKLGELIIYGQLIDSPAIHKDDIIAPSDFFRKVIAKKIDHFRGKGQYIDLKEARSVYVEIPSNMKLLEHAIGEWKLYVETKKEGVKLKVFTGNVGVGKTHFLSTFLYEISNMKEYYEKCIIVRAEFTERSRDYLIDAQRSVAKALLKDIKFRLGISDKIRDLMKQYYSPEIKPQIPDLETEINSWTILQVNELINTIGDICNPNNDIHKELGNKAPKSLCIFCDNSDQMNEEIVIELYQWCKDISGVSNSLVWVFFRPDTCEYLLRFFRNDSFTMRGIEPIIAPNIEDVLYKRLYTFYNRFLPSEQIVIGTNYYTINDVVNAVRYITDLTISSSDPILKELIKGKNDGETNLRAGLQAFISILGSHVITDYDYIQAIALRHDNKTKKAIERWPLIIEALMLNRRRWYSSKVGAIENMFSPPNIEFNGYYFIIIHLLQLLSSSNNSFQYGFIREKMNKLGYDNRSINETILHLSSRTEILNKELINTTFKERAFPLVFINKKDVLFDDLATIEISQWGRYNLNILIYELKYWKHIYYDIIFPKWFLDTLGTPSNDMPTKKLDNELLKVFNFLSMIEKSHLYPFSEDELNCLNIKPIMGNVKKNVRNILNKIMNPIR